MGQETLLIEAFLCTQSSISRSCLQSRHETGDQEEEEDGERRLAGSVCRQHYSNYTLPSLGPLLVPSGCKCYEIKYF